MACNIIIFHINPSLIGTAGPFLQGITQTERDGQKRIKSVKEEREGAKISKHAQDEMEQGNSEYRKHVRWQ